MSVISGMLAALVGAAGEPRDASPVIFAQLLGRSLWPSISGVALEDAVDPRLDRASMGWAWAAARPSSRSKPRPA